jgi:hypothetical protein
MSKVRRKAPQRSATLVSSGSVPRRFKIAQTLDGAMEIPWWRARPGSAGSPRSGSREPTGRRGRQLRGPWVDRTDGVGRPSVGG